MLWDGWGWVWVFFCNFFFICHIVCSSQKQKNDAIAPYPLLFRSYETPGLIQRQGLAPAEPLGLG